MIKVIIGSHFLAEENHLIKRLSVEIPHGAEYLSVKIFAEDEETLSYHVISRPSGEVLIQGQMEKEEEPSKDFVSKHTDMSKTDLEGELMTWQILNQEVSPQRDSACIFEKELGFDLDEFSQNPVFEEQT